MSDKLTRHREIWKKKKILRDIYLEWYRYIQKDLGKSKKITIEMGAGSGNFKEFLPGAVAADIEFCQWLDIVFDAHYIPFKENSLGNIVMIDVLHHLADPVFFFDRAAQVLEKGGRILLIEPFPTIFSLFIYKRFHPEPFNMDVDYFDKTNNRLKSSPKPGVISKKDPWDANQAAAYLLFFKGKEKFLDHFGSNFKFVKRKRMSCLLYPASGGFENKSLIPDALVPLFKLKEILMVPFRRLLAFRCYVVLEKYK